MNIKLGKLVLTRRLNDKVADSFSFAKEITTALHKYMNHNWGDLCDEDKKLNDKALEDNNDRIVASYQTSEGKVYIIKEWDRSATTVLFADEY